jgi:hypothetical protein
VIVKHKNKKMREHELVKLGFEKEEVSAEESGDKAYYYYTYYLTDNCIFTSSANDEVKNNDWWVYEEDSLFINTNNYSKVKNFISAFENIRIPFRKCI